MERMRRDLDYSLADVEDAMLEMMDALEIERPRRHSLWDLIVEKLRVKEIDFLTDRAEQMTKREKEYFTNYVIHLAFWRNKYGGEMRREAPVSHALALASIAVPLMLNYWRSCSAEEMDWLLTAAMQNYRSCAVRYTPNDEISERDIPLIKGELMTNIVLHDLTGASNKDAAYDNEFYAWLGAHEEEIRPRYSEFRKRGSFDQILVRELFGSVSKPISDGVL